MNLNIKLVLEEMAKLRTKLKEGFTNEEATFTKRLDEVTVDDLIWDMRAANLEESASAFDKTFTK
jgi:hypothetical protein